MIWDWRQTGLTTSEGNEASAAKSASEGVGKATSGAYVPVEAIGSLR